MRSPGAGSCAIGGRLLAVIGGAAPGVPPRGVVRTSWLRGSGVRFFKWSYIRLSAWIPYTCSGMKRVS
jgi:hypothetical protein